MGFVKEYNARTAKQAGTIVPVHLTVYEDRSFAFVTKTPPASDLLRKAAGVEKGTSSASQGNVGTIKRIDLESIAKSKMDDLNARDISGAIRIIEGTARSMGIQVEE
jgi:large subunit ribosomal protein L11